MITRQRRLSPLRRLWMPLLTAGFLCYFGYHAFTGSYGKWAMDRMKNEAVTLGAELDKLKTEHAALESRVALLRPESLDADLVDTKARTELNLLRPDEVVITFGASQQDGQ
jgi:cell division protein FtsB